MIKPLSAIPARTRRRAIFWAINLVLALGLAAFALRGGV